MKNFHTEENNNRHSLTDVIGEIFESYFYHYYSIDMEEDRVAPAIIVEKDDAKEFLIRINGSAKNDKNISVSISKDSILVKNEGRYGNAEHSSHQRSEDNFERSISLPSNVIPKKAEAFFDKGNLCVRVPKMHSKEGRPLEVS